MNKSLTKPLIRPLGGRWARVCLTALLTAVVTVGAQARATCESGTRACADSLGGAQDRTAVEGGTPSRTAGDICNMQHADGCFFAKLIPWFIHRRDSSSDVLF